MNLGAYLRSALSQTAAAVRVAPGLHAVATLSVALAMVLVGATTIVTQNALGVLASWGQGIGLTVFLEPDVAPGHGAAIADALRLVSGVDRVRYIPPEEAFSRLTQGLGPRSGLLDGVDKDLLPPSLEVTFQRGYDIKQNLSIITERVLRMPGVLDVEAMGDWAARLQAASDLLKMLAWGALVLSGLGCLYLVGATIKLAVFARREEIEILRLCGATNRYIRAPFWIEGALEGLCGGALGLILLGLLYGRVAPRVQLLLGGMLGGAHLHFPPMAQVGQALAAALGLGILGSHWAVRRHLEI